MFTNDYFTKAMGYVIDGESRGSKESAMKYLTGSGFMERQEAESYLAHQTRREMLGCGICTTETQRTECHLL